MESARNVKAKGNIIQKNWLINMIVITVAALNTRPNNSHYMFTFTLYLGFSV